MTLETGEHDVLIQGIAEVVTAECGSRVLHEYVDGKNDLEARMWRHATELGWLGIGIAEANGGLGLGMRGMGVLHHELGRRLVPGPFIATLAAVQWVEAFGDDSSKRRVLGPLLAGELSIAIPAAFDARALEAQDRSTTVSGQARSLLGSPLARMAVVRTADARWALIEVDGKTAKLTARLAWDPTRALCDLECEGAKVLLTVHDPKAGPQLAQAVSLAVMADSVGAAGTILQQTVEYLKTRVQFDRPIASFQALKHRAADLRIAHDLARQVAAQAYATAGGASADLWAALAKASVTDAFAGIAADCVQLHGGVGFTWDFDCHLYLKRAKLNQALVGSNESQVDRAFEALVEAVKEGRSTLEIEL